MILTGLHSLQLHLMSISTLQSSARGWAAAIRFSSTAMACLASLTNSSRSTILGTNSWSLVKAGINSVSTSLKWVSMCLKILTSKVSSEKELNEISILLSYIFQQDWINYACDFSHTADLFNVISVMLLWRKFDRNQVASHCMERSLGIFIVAFECGQMC